MSEEEVKKLYMVINQANAAIMSLEPTENADLLWKDFMVGQLFLWEASVKDRLLALMKKK